MVTQWWRQLPINRNETGWQSTCSTKATHSGAQLSLIGEQHRMEPIGQILNRLDAVDQITP